MADPQRPGRAPMTEDEIRAAWVTEPPRLAGRIELADYDPEWPRLFRREADRIRAVLGERVVRLEHVGSTSVPGLAAKPIIDMIAGIRGLDEARAAIPVLFEDGKDRKSVV